MNSEINKKTPAFIYAKEFKLSKLLSNLQAYKLATGDVGQTEQKEASRKQGNNLGTLYGNLITKASLTDKNSKRKQDEIDQDSRKRWKCKSQKKKKKDGSPQYPVPTVTSDSLDEPLALPECLLCGQNEKPEQRSSQEESSESSDSQSVDFFGLAQDEDESSSEEICSNDDIQNSERCMSEKSCTSEASSSRRLYKEALEPFTTYSCSRCHRRGHLTEHCTIAHTATDSNHEHNVQIAIHRQTDIQDLFLQCRRLKRSKNVSCSDCGNASNLAFCFECRLTLCDGRGHLIEHLLNFPTHTKIYSHKLQKLLKCSNSSCNVVDINQLLVCPQCLSKIFDKQYSLINATWSERGLRAITNVLCCDEHFHWHRMNCYDSSEEMLFSRENLAKLKQERNGLLSEFFF